MSAFLINPSDLTDLLAEGNLNSNYFTLNRLKPALTAAAWEVSESLTSNYNMSYDTISDRFTGSVQTQEDIQLQKAEQLLTIAHAVTPSSIRWMDRGGMGTSTGYSDSLNALQSFQVVKEVRCFFRAEANKYMRRAGNNQIQSVSGSSENFTSEIGYAIGSPYLDTSGSNVIY